MTRSLLNSVLLLILSCYTISPVWSRYRLFDNNQVCVTCADFIYNQITFRNQYSFIRYDQNYIQWNDYQSIKPFFEKLAQAEQKKVKILHIGDSHVQADIFTQTIRKKLQDIFGSGGRGLIFPYSTARTHAGSGYVTWHTGKWEHSKNVNANPIHDLGVTGVTSRTTDSRASFRFYFTPTIHNSVNQLLRIYCRKGTDVFDILIRQNESEEPIILTCEDTTIGYVETLLPRVSDTLVISFRPRYGQKLFECYGVSLENPADRGILYHSVGINGAAFSSILKQNLMPQQLRELEPDLVVIDMGGNDFYIGGLIPQAYEEKLKAIVFQIQENVPKASIIISCPQDLYRRYYNVKDCAPAAEIAQKVSIETGSAFYNYYQITGGRFSMLKWQGNGLAKYDRVHLSYDGYIQRGELFVNALLRSYAGVLNGFTDGPEPIYPNPLQDLDSSSITNAKQSQQYAKVLAQQPSIEMEEEPTVIYQKKIYVVKSGDNLGKIDSKYKTTVKQIME
ncbi:MAG: GDSL-type esterase/lipase family protein, partial [Bacteroidia bacterium]|nr:GDSL-type esterase/lipase family protein [Bacteroidia bacterium]